MMIAEHNLRDGIAHVLDHVFGGRLPLSALIDDRAHATQYHVSVSPAQHVAAALNRFRSFGHITNRHVRHAEDGALFLNRPAIAQGTESVALKLYEIEETEGRVKLYGSALHTEALHLT